MMSVETLEKPQLSPVETKGRTKILIIDDEEILVEVLSDQLKRQGFDIVSAASGEEGLRTAKQEKPSLIVLDLRLPDTSGFDICERLVDSSETCNIPVLILSGMESPDILRNCRAAGGMFFVRKPYDPNALLILIDQSLKESRDWD